VTGDPTEFTMHFADRGTPTLTITGELDLATAATFRSRVLSATEHTEGDLILDMRNVTYIDSSGLSVVLEGRDLLERAGRTLIINDPSASVTTIFTICGLTDRIAISIPESGAAGPEPVTNG
jgi:anti-sigma B factor antagonist